ncbi:transposable element Tcb2 transposase [Trichonephila clavipes]|nr:transposable element Tcb2 transposase [Trichonephila clavipes]
MPGKRARRYFSQLSEFERSLINGMKTSGWSTRRVAGQMDRSECAVEIVGSSGHEKVPTSGKPGLERPGRPRGERGSKDHAANTCGPHSDSFNDTSRRRRNICSTNNFHTPCRSKS